MIGERVILQLDVRVQHAAIAAETTILAAIFLDALPYGHHLLRREVALCQQLDFMRHWPAAASPPVARMPLYNFGAFMAYAKLRLNVVRLK